MKWGITNIKRTPSGSKGYLTGLGTYFNVDTKNKVLEFPANTYFFYQNKNILISASSFTVPLANGALIYNLTTNLMRCALPSTATENELLLGSTYLNSLVIDGYYTVDGLEQKVRHTNSFAYIVHSSSILNIDTTEDVLVLPLGDKYIFYGTKVISLPKEEIKVPLKTGGFLYYNTKTNNFNVGVADTLLTSYSLMFGYISSRAFNKHMLNFSYTVDGKQSFGKTTITKEMLDFIPVTDIPNVTSKWRGGKGVLFADSIGWYDGNPFGGEHKEVGTIAKGYPSYN